MKSAQLFPDSYPDHPPGINYNIGSDVTELGEDFEVTPHHVIKLCDDVISKKLSLNDLSVIAYYLMFSIYFDWDASTETGKIINDAIFSWDNPDITYELTLENVKLWKEYLITGINNLQLKP